LQVQGQPGLHSDTLPQKEKEKKDAQNFSHSLQTLLLFSFFWYWGLNSGLTP
jgi:hypothetical protein